MPKKLTSDEFIARANAIHGDRYDYSLVEYVNAHTKVKIICKEHGIFEQMPYSHLNGNGCMLCGGKAKLTTKDFIQKAKKTHNNRYDYSLVEYVNGKTKVKIICNEHGVFEQSPTNHTQFKHGCPQCALLTQSQKNRKTTKDFILHAKQIHGNRYDYSLVHYTNAHKKIQIICKIHGAFLQKPNCHLNGHGCLACSGNKTLSNNEFIKKSRSVHGDRYDYSLVTYVNSKTKVQIICKKHGIFEQTPSTHLRKCGCPSCVNKKRPTTEEFIRRANDIHNDKYDYSLVEYKNANTTIKIICPKHGIFEQKASNHGNLGHGCPECKKLTISLLTKLTNPQFIQKAKSVHGDRYDYSLVKYINNITKVKIICNNHGIFEQVPSTHLSNHGCPKCTSMISKPEIELQEYISSIYNGKILTNYRKIISPYELDIYLPDINLAIEFNGEYWHSFEDAKRRDKETKKRCIKRNIRLMIVWERYWKNDMDKMKSYISAIINNRIADFHIT